MNYPIDKILPLLRGVRRSTSSSWMALCPGHDDKSPSLSVRRYDDGSISVKCFTGCATGEILKAVGLSPSDLFPRKRDGEHSFRPAPSPTPWREIIAHLSEDLVAVQIGTARIAAGDELSEADLDRLAVAALRVSDLLVLLRGQDYGRK